VAVRSDLAPVLPSLRLGPQDFLYLDAYNLLCGGVTRHVLEVRHHAQRPTTTAARIEGFAEAGSEQHSASPLQGREP